ncbi:MAG TPA: transposase [Longimicrobium sp.]|nr:transposase [Longimicrobium sp.]
MFLHLVWSTWRREPFITAELRERIYGADHVHLLVRIPTTISIAELVRRLKGTSSHLVTHVLQSPEPFKWQGGYGVFSVSKRHVPVVRDYVLNQERHHRDGPLHHQLERDAE